VSREKTRKALIVGIDFYRRLPRLYGCANDALRVAKLLQLNRDAEESVNFHAPRVLTAKDSSTMIDRTQFKDAIEELFCEKKKIALLYFAGHGSIDATGGYLNCSDASRADDGVSLSEVMALANQSPADNRIIILDSCFSGAAANRQDSSKVAEVKEGTTILTASTEKQYAEEESGGGLFTGLFLDALDGAASNLVGDITPGSVYAHIDESLGNWTQRPIFKTNVTSFVSLRRVTPPVERASLKQIPNLFPQKQFQYPLDPTYEPEMTGRPEGTPLPDPAHTRIFAILQQLNRVNIVVPIDAKHMWHAAMNYKSCQLTALGEHYRRLVIDGHI
jgi:hypothetical protein